MSGESNQETQDIFDNLADDGVWPSRYGELNHINYNFFTRRDSVFDLIRQERVAYVLDIGCGTGDYFEILSRISQHYSGIDFSTSMISQAHEKYGKHSKKPMFKVGSAEKLPFGDNTFDLVCAIGLIQYFDDPDAVLKEIKRVLKPDGILLMQSYQIDLFRKMATLFGIEKTKEIARLLVGLLLKRKFSVFAVDRSYTKQALDSLVLRHGFSIEAHHFNNYHILPNTLRRCFSKMYIALSEEIEKNSRTIYRPFAVNYVGRYRLKKSA